MHLSKPSKKIKKVFLAKLKMLMKISFTMSIVWWKAVDVISIVEITLCGLKAAIWYLWTLAKALFNSNQHKFLNLSKPMIVSINLLSNFSMIVTWCHLPATFPFNHLKVSVKIQGFYPLVVGSLWQKTQWDHQTFSLTIFKLLVNTVDLQVIIESPLLKNPLNM